jgi:hypothetical protein
MPVRKSAEEAPELVDIFRAVIRMLFTHLG